MKKISKRQEDILSFIKSEVKKKGYPPSVGKLARLSAWHQVQLFMDILPDWKAKDLSEETQRNREQSKYWIRKAWKR